MRRVSAVMTAVLAAFLTLVTATVAAAADYPPAVEGTTEVQGTGTPNEVASTGAGGLPHTGFDGVLLWTALALVVIGVAMIVVTRRRAHS